MAEISGGHRVRGPVIVVALLLVAAAAGAYAGLQLAHDHPRTEAPQRLDAAAPIVGTSPAHPSWAPYAADPTNPPLTDHLTYTTEAIDHGANRWLVDLPTDWVILKDDNNAKEREATFVPRDALHAGYLVRIERIDTAGATETPTEMRDERLQAVKSYQNFEVVSMDADSLDFTYRSRESTKIKPDLHRRNILRWIAIPGKDAAGLEISVAGRIADGPGLEALLAHVAASAQFSPQ